MTAFIPAHLGGKDRTVAHNSVPMAEAVFLEAYQNPTTRQWFLKVKVEGGRVINGVQILYNSDGERTGERPRLPVTGAAGLIVWPSFTRNSKRCIWLGSFDDYPFGVDTANVQDQLQVFPSYAAEIVTETGGRTNRFPGGDTFFAGPRLEKARIFKVRLRRLGEFKHDLVTLEEVERREGKLPQPMRIDLEGIKSMEEIRLNMKEGVGYFHMLYDDKSFLWRMKSKPKEPPGEVQISGVSGQSLEAHVMNQSGVEAEISSLTLTPSSAELQVAAGIKHGRLTLDKTLLDADVDMLKVARASQKPTAVAMAELVDKNFAAVKKSFEQLAAAEKADCDKINAILAILGPLAALASAALSLADAAQTAASQAAHDASQANANAVMAQNQAAAANAAATSSPPPTPSTIPAVTPASSGSNIPSNIASIVIPAIESLTCTLVTAPDTQTTASKNIQGVY